jgi:ClpP class serine protease
LVLFKDFVSKNRPQLDIETVATGETWFGPDALAMGLVDELRTVDDVLMDLDASGAELLSVTYAPPPKGPTLSLGGNRGGSGAGRGISPAAMMEILQWLATSSSESENAGLGLFGAGRMGRADPGDSLLQRYMAIDDAQLHMNEETEFGRTGKSLADLADWL